MRQVLHIIIYIAGALLLVVLAFWFIAEFIKAIPELALTALIVGIFFVLPIWLIEEHRGRKE